MPLPRAALYHRVSTVDQDPELARAELRAQAAARGLRVVLELEETGSGANNDRPGLQRLLAAAERRQVDVVLVWKLDRFGRSALDLLGNLEALERVGVRFVCTSQGIDTGGRDAMARLLLTMLAAVAEFERDLIRSRTRFGLERARAKGKRLGRPPLPKPDHADVARLREMGATWEETARELGCSPTAARRVLELAKKGVEFPGSGPVENGAAAGPL